MHFQVWTGLTLPALSARVATNYQISWKSIFNFSMGNKITHRNTFISY